MVHRDGSIEHSIFTTKHTKVRKNVFDYMLLWFNCRIHGGA